jgi:hypothetical protein
MVAASRASNATGFAALPTASLASGGIARLAYARCANAGIKVDALLPKANLTRSQIDNPQVRITVRSQIKFLDVAAKALKDEFLGLHLAQAFDLREIGLLYYVMASSEFLAILCKGVPTTA